MGEWLNGITGWLTANPSWVAAAIFIVAFIECVAIAGIVVPGTVLMFAIAALAGSGILGLSDVLLLGFAGGILGDLVSYAVGRRFHQNIRRLPGLRSHPEWMTGAEAYFQRYGIASLLVGRFIGPLRPMLPMIAGMCDMPFPRFLAVSIIATIGWSIAYLLPGWAAGAAIRLPLPEGFWGEAAVVGGVLAVVFGLSIQSSMRKQRYATRLISGLCLVTMVALFIGWPWLDKFDQGLMTLVQEHRSEAAQNIVLLVTSIGDFHTQLLAAALVVLVLLVARQWRHAAFAVVTMLGTACANGALKAFFARARPEVLVDPLTTYSMPSGHSSAAFALFMTLAVLAGRSQPVRLRLAWLVLGGIPALAIALSRVYLGVHWPTDILAGMMLALGICAASLTIIQHREPLPAMSARVWWLLVPAVTALLGGFAVNALSHAVLRYQYLM
ncbi:bifunctional DedA family/phosphatase PAP2 family protein [Pseudomonas sp. LJDD11]|uniref:bifunctional DedA family/phosphatase PAP2 family protein n=1 Tax=Pseudomonas sp. LJDD11 TaxID=2931984 RepID=UPI00211BA1A9|nr:bifunctional DedA family/phosphatase PAP2 family protein [Pseudomonas sp. LJDD11]MCQ9424581.1 bifunctional DedA family/phosphatase PAP2 family protein [Pseudomonas sp. LJDD11]